MKLKGRKILLLVDNCPAHPEMTLSNVKIVFLPPNTTSKLQPCDAGIIENLKRGYRRRFLRHLLHSMDDKATARALARSVTVLDAICRILFVCHSVYRERMPEHHGTILQSNATKARVQSTFAISSLLWTTPI